MKKFIVILGLAFCSAIHTQASLTDGLIASYSFSGNANDGSGNGNNGAISNAIFATDRFGLAQGAISCPNANSSIVVQNSTSLGVTNNLTISAWVNLAANQTNSTIIVKGLVTDYWNYGLGISVSGTNMSFGYAKTSGTAGPTPPLLSTGIWEHIAVTIDQTQNALKFYLNGQLLTKPLVVFGGSFNTNNVSSIIGPNAGNLYIGNNNSSGLSGSSFAGAIDDIYIYNRTLSDAEIQQLYQLQNTPSINLVKAVTVSFANLSVGTNYQLQVSGDLNSWTNFGTPITATNSFMISSNYWNVSDWNQLFFRLH